MNKYLMQAIDAYPFDLEEAYQALEFAMSVDNECPHTLCLMGRMYADELEDYVTAIGYFEDALKSDVYAVKVYPYYISALMNLEQLDAAHKAIDFAMTIKGSDKGRLLFLKVMCFEYAKNYKAALKTLKASEVYSFNSDFKALLKETRTRIEEKKNPKIKGRKKQKKKKAKKNK